MRMHEITQALHEQRNQSYYAAEDFEALNTPASLSDARRPRLTLMHLQRLRQKRDKDAELRAAHLEFLPMMYEPRPKPKQAADE